MMDVYAAWHIFEQTGKIEDYIRYSQLKSLDQYHTQEDIHADKHRWIGNYGKNHRGE